MNDIVWMTMRRMRTPLIVLLLVYFLSMMAMIAMPGVDAEGQPYHMSLLDAAYFIAILQTTIGLGEIPFGFTEAQRIVVLWLLLPNVVAWLYSIGAMLGLILDKQFQATFQRRRFSRQARAIREPFYIVCGFGSTGFMSVSGLLARGIHVVVIEPDEDKVRRMVLLDRFAHLPALVGRGDDRVDLELAGLQRENCKGVICTTNDDQVNLKIAITVELLRPGIVMIARSENQGVCDNMTSFNTDFVINPYRIFAERIALALSSPVKFLVQDWLLSVPGTTLRELTSPPSGRWIVCGVGRFGKRVIEQLEKQHLPVTVLDARADRLHDYQNTLLGRGAEAQALEAAGIADAVGIVAATNNDIDNLSIILTARNLNPAVFVITRQDRIQNTALFDSSGADLVALRSRIVARQILAIVTTPLLHSFLQHLIRSDESFAERIATRLRNVLNNRAPNIWVIELTGEIAGNLRFVRSLGQKIKLEHIIRNSRSEANEYLSCVCLSMERGAQRIFLPDNKTELQIDDRLLFAGRDLARRQMLWTLLDSHSLLVNASGKHLPRGALWRWLVKR